MNPVREIWSIALAAGAGKRLTSVTGGIPKQFWRPAGGTSLLEHTLDRLHPITGPSRTVTIVDESHRSCVAAIDRRRPLGQVVYQPQDRGTAAGVLLPLLRVLTDAPDAIVVITPSDHAVAAEGLFHRGLRHAINRVRTGATDTVLFGVEPTSAATDYGWVTTGGPHLM